MAEVLFSRDTWMPRVIDYDGDLHSPRIFTVQVREEHVEVVRRSVRRHVLLHSAMLPLTYDAGIGRPPSSTRFCSARRRRSTTRCAG